MSDDDDLRLPKPKETCLERKVTGRAVETWPTPDDEFIGLGSTSEERVACKERYEANAFAVKRYASGESERQVIEAVRSRFAVKLWGGTVYKLYKRCLERNPSTGDICGLWACVPQWRATDPNKKRQLNTRHGLSVLFAAHPELEASMCEFVHRRKTGKMRRVSVLTAYKVWRVFLALCRRRQLHTQDAWPFNEDLRGYEAIRRWYQKEKFRRPSAAARNHLHKDVAKEILGDQKAAELPPPAVTVHKAYSQVQLDEHRSDEMWQILLPGSGADEWIASGATRVWALAVVETEVKVVLSSAIALGNSYGRHDVLRAVHRALVPPPRFGNLRIMDDEWHYDQGAAYPAELPEFAMNSWEHLSMDGHGTHISAETKEALEPLLRCLVHIGEPGKPTVRSEMEYFFNRMAKHSSWFESAVGNQVRSAARRDPEKGAMESLMYLPWAEELWDLRCRNYNVTYLKELDASPLGALQRMARRGEIFRCHLGELGGGNLHRLLPKHVRKLKFKRVSGYGVVYLNLGYTYYTGPELWKAHDLMRQDNLDATVYVQEDARFAFVVPHAFPDRVYKVVCGGRFRKNPHTFEHRRFVCANAKSKYFQAVSKSALLEVGAIRGLSRAVSTDAGRAQLFSNFYSFMDRYGAGVVVNVDMTSDDDARLLDFNVGDDVDDTLSDDALEPVGGERTDAPAGRHVDTPKPPFDRYGIYRESP